MKRAFKGVWIPKEIWLSKELTLQEKVFLAEIDSLDNDNGCFASNKYFAEFFGLTKGRCSQIINSLEEKGFITISYLYGENKSVEKRVIKVVNKLNTPSKFSKGGSKNTKDPYLENDKDNNPSINNPTNIKRNEDETDPIINLLIENKIIHPAGITQTLVDDLNDITNEFGFKNPEEMIAEAVKDSVRGNGRTWKFVYNKLNLWRKQGIKTLSELKTYLEGEINGGRVHSHRNNNTRSSKTSASYEQALREADLARRAFNR